MKTAILTIAAVMLLASAGCWGDERAKPAPTPAASEPVHLAIKFIQHGGDDTREIRTACGIGALPVRFRDGDLGRATRDTSKVTCQGCRAVMEFLPTGKWVQ